MKATIIALVVVGLMVTALAFRDSAPISYVKEQVEVVKEVEVTPDWARDEEAVKAAQDVIKRKELEAQLKSKDADIIAKEAELKALKDERKALATELTAY